MSPPTNPEPNTAEPLVMETPKFQPRPPQRPRNPPEPSSSLPDSSSPASLNGPGLDDGSGSPSAPGTSDSPSGQSPGSTGRPPRILDEGIRKAYEKTAKTVALAASGMLEVRFGQGTGAMLMTARDAENVPIPITPDDEAGDIAAPAARILARHAPMPGGSGVASDLADAVELVVAVAGYAMNALARRAAVLGAMIRGDGATPGGPDESSPPPTAAPPSSSVWPPAPASRAAG